MIHRVELCKVDRLAEVADALALDGWKLVTVAPHPPDARFVALFRRDTPATPEAP